MLAVLLGCGLRRREVADLYFTHLQQREEHCAIVDLIGESGYIRTVAVPDWVKATDPVLEARQAEIVTSSHARPPLLARERDSLDIDDVQQGCARVPLKENLTEVRPICPYRAETS